MLRQNRWEKAWMILEKKELRYLERQREEKKPSALRQKLEEKIPEKLEDTLNAAFVKAFDLVFEKPGLLAFSREKRAQILGGAKE